MLEEYPLVLLPDEACEVLRIGNLPYEVEQIGQERIIDDQSTKKG